MADWTVGEVRDVRDGDHFHESVRTRWLATRLSRKQLDAILDDGESHPHKGKEAAHTLSARADQSSAKVSDEHTIEEPYIPMASPHTIHTKDKRDKFWNERFAREEDAHSWVC